jgi:hypothetical protein
MSILYTETAICRCISSTLENRNIITTLTEETMRASAAKGFQHGEEGEAR